MWYPRTHAKKNRFQSFEIEKKINRKIFLNYCKVLGLVAPNRGTAVSTTIVCNSRRTLRQKADEARGFLILMTGTTHILTLPHGMVTYNDASTFSILPPYPSSLIAKKQKNSNHSNVFITKGKHRQNRSKKNSICNNQRYENTKK